MAGAKPYMAVIATNSCLPVKAYITTVFDKKVAKGRRPINCRINIEIYGPCLQFSGRWFPGVIVKACVAHLYLRG